jgi:tRNA G10  N-methylase Trm11
MTVAELEQEVVEEPPKKVFHPAKFSPEIIRVMDGWIRMESFYTGKRQRRMRILDPMAGVGGVHVLPGLTFGIEIEPEWANQHPRTQVGDALALPWPKNKFDVICVSPVYGNRMSDSFTAMDSSKRIGYHFQLGRKPSKGSSATMHWGQDYRRFHHAAWVEAVRVLRPGGLFILNISDFMKMGERQPVSSWHCYVLDELGLNCFARRDVPTSRMRYGQNYQARVDCEHVFAFRLPE